ncbi:hypothetical protein [Enterobacillus tribolii]|uniref:Uncharacterized protein n=1 Tax=Enterobacillus tribolii TaxID=1487935 RepID=A0A370QNL3_9GAMM|nr:hypothetical protein [Enterobacillus tribolii]MBW7982021.1 hypothetical protein [Enterobacillus tribolii]RDK89959.1 hypothetical protein C8D90_106165 [Enterobacillus tribolii]
MSTPQQIAEAILDVIGNKKKNNRDVFFYSVGTTFINTTTDIAYLGIDFFDTENRGRNQQERIRMFARMKRGVTKFDLTKIIEIIIDEYTYRLSEDQLSTVLAKKAGEKVGGYITKTVLITEVASLFTSKFLTNLVFGAGLSSVFSAGSSVSRAIYSSEELRNRFPSIYNRLRMSGDLDLFFFLVEAQTKPFLQAIELKNRNPAAWNEVFELVNKGLQ